MTGYKKEYGGEIQKEEVIKGKIKISEYAAAGVVIRYNHEKKMNEILLIQRARNDTWPLQWEIPRGKCDKEIKSKSNLSNISLSQLILTGLKREVREETGLDIKPIKFIDKFVYIFPDRNSAQYSFLCRMIDPNQEVKLSFEHEDYKWVVSMAEVQLLSVSKELLVVISKVFNNDGKIVDYPKEMKRGNNIEKDNSKS